MTNQFDFSSLTDFLHLVNSAFQEIAREGSGELLTSEQLAENLGVQEETIVKTLEHAMSFGLVVRHGQPGAYYYGPPSDQEALANNESINVNEVPNRRAAIIFMLPDETEIAFSKTGCLELTDDFNGVMLTPTVVDKLRRFLADSEGR